MSTNFHSRDIDIRNLISDVRHVLAIALKARQLAAQIHRKNPLNRSKTMSGDRRRRISFCIDCSLPFLNA